MRKTKIICTIGPSTEKEDVLREMCRAGMNVARLNFSHGTYEEHQHKIDVIRKVREELDYPLPIMLDTKGPEYRIQTFEGGKAMLEEGQDFIFTTEDVTGDRTRVSVSYKNLMQELHTGDRILVNNGLLVFEVKQLTETEALCQVISGGEISNRKSMNFPGHVFEGDYLSDQDRSDLLFGIKNDIDFVAASFVSNKENIRELRDFLDLPIKNYSSGMAARLGFAIATIVKPDILICDEVLSVGDIAFQQKCEKRMTDMRDNGTTLLFVSHNIDSVRNVCDHALWINKGDVKGIGPVDEVTEEYMQFEC